MTDLEVVQATLAIQALVGRYAQCADSGQAAGCAALFAHDATFGVMDKVRRGPAEIEALIDGMVKAATGRGGKHFNSSILVETMEADRATARADMMFVGAGPGEPWAIVAVGEYHDSFVRIDGAWKFQSRSIVFTPKPPAV